LVVDNGMDSNSMYEKISLMLKKKFRFP